MRAFSCLVEQGVVLDCNSGAAVDRSCTAVGVVAFVDIRYHSLVVEARHSRCREAAERELDKACTS